MTAAERIYELVKRMPDQQVREVLAWVETLSVNHDLQTQPRSASADITSRTKHISIGTLTGLRGMAKPRERTPTDEEVREEYTDYLVNKYQ
ncbi:hypothetical protein ACKFKG_00690 [Phormidesmis sp. 146-35]